MRGGERRGNAPQPVPGLARLPLSGLTEANLEPENLPVALRADPDSNHHRGGPHRLLPPHFHLHRIDNEEGTEALQLTLGLGRYLLVELLGKTRDGLPAEAPPAEVIRDLLYLAGRDALHNHLHQSEHEHLIVALVALKELCLEGILTVTGHLQFERAYP